ncbi:MAG: DJ-1/PfpI family protein [Chromatiales bacterium]|jgi:cyclohexyl-isocyanide hydratase|nr:DJ-1/PfpI family protein [Chromatiales bacterium]MDX9766698.1 DJ-1/PfpI family protein [Ectothiorhodospiraceae bacterium]
MKVAFVVFDQMTALDFIGFYDPVTRLRSMAILNDFEWRICARSRRVVDDRGLRLEADVVDEPLDAFDLLFLPGGFGTRALQHDVAFVDWLKTAAPVPLKVSVCTGALLLGAAGFLSGRRATTHPMACQELERYCGSVASDRVVDEGDVITAGGVSASIDLGLHVVQRLAGSEACARIAAQMDYPYR